MSKLGTFVVAGSIVYLISQVPGAGAHEFNSVAQAKQHYSGGPCPHDPWNELMIPASTCLHGGGSLEECQALIPSGQTHTDLYAFTRHPTQMAELDPVSVLKLHEGGETCIQTALKADSPVTQTCFEDISDPTIRTVSVIEGLPLGAAHQGLKPGQTIRHIGLQLVSGTGECGAFHETTAPSDLGEGAICILTSLKSGGEVAQLCFNPHHPGAVTLKRNDDVSLTFDDSDGKPFSLVIRKPQEQGLNIGPDVPVGVENLKEHVLPVRSDDSLSERGRVQASPVSDLPCPNKAEGLSFWGALRLW